MEQLKVVQHNVLNWRERRYGLTATYLQLDADVILLNSHGVPHDDPFKIHGFTIYKTNHANTHTDGTAIAIRSSIKHKLLDIFISDTLAIEIDTLTGPSSLSTLYQPPARNYPRFYYALQKARPSLHDCRP